MIQTIARNLLASHLSRILTGNHRNEYLDAVWDMYQNTYKSIGTHVNDKHHLLYDYDRWSIVFSEDKPIQFSLFKTTSYGYKSCLSGFDGSAEGKEAQKSDIRKKYTLPGYYGEVSHSLKEMALKHNAPVVCAVYASQIIGRPVDPVGDLEYRRSLSGVGMITKMLVGNPKGIPTTSHTSPSCPIIASGVGVSEATDSTDLHDHVASMVLNSLLSSSPISL